MSSEKMVSKQPEYSLCTRKTPDREAWKAGWNTLRSYEWPNQNRQKEKQNQMRSSSRERNMNTIKWMKNYKSPNENGINAELMGGSSQYCTRTSKKKYGKKKRRERSKSYTKERIKKHLETCKPHTRH